MGNGVVGEFGGVGGCRGSGGWVRGRCVGKGVVGRLVVVGKGVVVD